MLVLLGNVLKAPKMTCSGQHFAGFGFAASYALGVRLTPSTFTGRALGIVRVTSAWESPPTPSLLRSDVMTACRSMRSLGPGFTRLVWLGAGKNWTPVANWSRWTGGLVGSGSRR